MKHRWGEPVRDATTSRRSCQRCPLIKITRHEPDNFPPHWIEFERDGAKVSAVKTPACEEA